MVALHDYADRKVVRVVCSRVKFRQLTGNDIANALAFGDWQGKAGGYAIQDLRREYPPSAGLLYCWLQPV